jgi:hypothetical protein
MDLENTPQSFTSDVDDDSPMAKNVSEPAGERLDAYVVAHPELDADPEGASLRADAVKRDVEVDRADVERDEVGKRDAVEVGEDQKREAILAAAIADELERAERMDHERGIPPVPKQRPGASPSVRPADRAIFVPADSAKPVQVSKIDGLYDVRELLRSDVGRTSNDRDAAIYFDEHARDVGSAINQRASEYVLARSATAQRDGLTPANGDGLYGDVIVVGENRAGELNTTPGRIERAFGTVKDQAISATELRDQLQQERGHHM